MFKHSYYLLLMTLTVLVFLSGCNSTYTSSNISPKLLDTEFPNFHEQTLETEEQIFAIDESMIAFIDKNIAEQYTEKNKLTKLAHAVFDRSKLSLSYKASANTTARETFNNGAANCLSLTIMTYAMTQHLGLKSAFQNVNIPEFWTRRKGNTLINRHINLKVKPHVKHSYMLSDTSITIDFDPQQGMNKFDSTEVTKSQMVSFFYSNIAASYLIDNEPTKAYAYLRAAVKQDPKNEGAWLNLGVLSSQHQLYDQAQSYYEKALAIRPTFSSAYENLALLYARQGDPVKAQNLLESLRKKRIKNPYYHMVQGDIAIESQSYEQAIKHYKKAVSLNAEPHEFHFRLAKAYYRLGDLSNTYRYLKIAKRKAKDIDISEQYASKISTLLASR